MSSEIQEKQDEDEDVSLWCYSVKVVFKKPDGDRVVTAQATTPEFIEPPTPYEIRECGKALNYMADQIEGKVSSGEDDTHRVQ